MGDIRTPELDLRGFVRTLARLAQPHRRSLALGSLFLLTETAVALAVPWIGGQAAEVLFGAATTQLPRLLGVLALLVTAQAGVQALGNYLAARRMADVLARLRRQVYDHLQSLPLGYFQQQQHGRMLSILSNDVAMVGQFMSQTVVGLLPMAATSLGAVAMMLSIDPLLAALALAAVPLFFLLVKLLGRGMRPLSQAQQEAYAQMVATADENLQMMPAIKAFSREALESGRHGARVDELRRLTLLQHWVDSALGPGVYWLAALAALALLGLAGDRLASGELGKGALVSFLLYTSLLTRPVSAFSETYGQYQHARAALERVCEVLAQPGEPYQPEAPALQASAGTIEFERVDFGYPGRAPLFRNFSLRIEGGQTLAITGSNGAGKSTLVALLLRFALPQAGCIRIDGQRIDAVALQSLRQRIALVPQQVYLFNASVRDNIAYGLAGADDAAIERAARLAQAHGFIEQLPQGYDTPIGDRGVRLSGGQCQRLALARALLRDPRIVILDEATSMFDPQAELDFLRDCASVLAGRTVILITHRSASLALAQRVIRLTPGDADAPSLPQVNDVLNSSALASTDPIPHG